MNQLQRLSGLYKTHPSSYPRKARSPANEPIGGGLCLLLCGSDIQRGCELFEQPFLNWEISDLCGHFLVLKEEVNTYSQFDPH